MGGCKLQIVMRFAGADTLLPSLVVSLLLPLQHTHDICTLLLLLLLTSTIPGQRCCASLMPISFVTPAARAG
jgi:hypothetical protein